jgi:hypothetical protein
MEYLKWENTTPKARPEWRSRKILQPREKSDEGLKRDCHEIGTSSTRPNLPKTHERGGDADPPYRAAHI